MVRFWVLLLLVLLISGMISGAAPRTATSGESLFPEPTYARFIEELRKADPKTASFVDETFLDYLRETYGEGVYRSLFFQLVRHMYGPEIWYQRTGRTALVLRDECSGALNPESPAFRSDIRVLPDSAQTEICVVGDVSFADNYEIMPALLERGKGIRGVLSDEVLDVLRSADILLVNSEFAFTNRGEPIPGKVYTFRGNPENVKYLEDMGTDIVTLANNHVYDFGEDGFLDTLKTFRDADIPFIGAGEDLEEASKPFYFIVNGRKYGFTAATRAEKNILTPGAEPDAPGVLRMYDMTRYLDVLREAEAECDISIAYVHWGKEKSRITEDVIREDAALMAEAGADVIVGAHAHVLQEIDYCGDVPVFYNIGNFIFDEASLDTVVLRLTVTGTGEIRPQVLPCLQEDRFTGMLHGSEANRLLDSLKHLSANALIDRDGNVSRKPAA